MPVLSFQDFLDCVETWILENERSIAGMWPQKGGWEGAAQASIGSFILEKDSTVEILREQPVYTSGRKAADFLLNTSAPANNKLIVELKCQSFENHHNFRAGLESDISKLSRELSPQFQGAALLVLGIYFTEHADIPDFFDRKILGNGEVGICWALDLNSEQTLIEHPCQEIKMETPLKKEDLPLLVAAMDKYEGTRDRLLGAKEVGAEDKVGGDMSIPEPVQVDSNGSMSEDEFNKCSMIMSVLQNMVQKTITDAARTAGIEATDALKNMNAWVQGYTEFPFPIFNFKDTQSDVFQKSEFSLKADPDVVETVVNIKNVDGLKDAVIGALKNSGGNLATHKAADRAFKYFGIITGYHENEISGRIVKFQMNLKTTDTESLCVHFTKTNLDTAYDTYQFTANKQMLLGMQERMGEQLLDEFADKLLEFIRAFYDQQLKNYQTKLADLLKSDSKDPQE